MIYGIIVSSVYMNITGIMYSLVFLVALIVMFYGKTIMTRSLFDNMMDVACFYQCNLRTNCGNSNVLVSWGNCGW